MKRKKKKNQKRKMLIKNYLNMNHENEETEIIDSEKKIKLKVIKFSLMK